MRLTGGKNPRVVPKHTSEVAPKSPERDSEDVSQQDSSCEPVGE